jgi:hypothetical protein
MAGGDAEPSMRRCAITVVSDQELAPLQRMPECAGYSDVRSFPARRALVMHRKLPVRRHRWQGQHECCGDAGSSAVSRWLTKKLPLSYVSSLWSAAATDSSSEVPGSLARRPDRVWPASAYRRRAALAPNRSTRLVAPVDARQFRANSKRLRRVWTASHTRCVRLP